MKLVIHAGTHKTATTAFQEICFQNSALLQSSGVHYPCWEGRKNHGFLTLPLRQGDFGYIRTLFLDAVGKCGPTDTILISGEGLERCFIDVKMAVDLEQIAREAGISDIAWVVVQRDPFDYFQSLYGELSKQLLAMNYVEMANSILKHGFISATCKYYDYMFVFDTRKFYGAFSTLGLGPLTILPFEDFTSGFAGRILFENVLGRPEIASVMELPQDQGVNQRLSPEEIEFRYVCNFLGITPDARALEKNKSLIDELTAKRLAQISKARRPLRNRFAKRFQTAPQPSLWQRLRGKSTTS